MDCRLIFTIIYIYLENNGRAKIDITRHLKAVELDNTRDGLEPAQEISHLFKKRYQYTT